MTRAFQPDLAVVLGGGGARGFCHVGVLRALNALGLHPGIVVGVSMGGIVGATYALNPYWDRALQAMDLSGFPETFATEDGTPVDIDLGDRLRKARDVQKGLADFLFDAGAGASKVAWGRSMLSELVLGKRLDDSQAKIVLSATDLGTGERVLMGAGDAVDAMYASSALAGLMPPLDYDGRKLIDGAYSDMAPVDVSRDLGARFVIAVDACQIVPDILPKTGAQILQRAIELTQSAYAAERFREADLVLKPDFGRRVRVLDFNLRKLCIRAGESIVQDRKEDILNGFKAATTRPSILAKVRAKLGQS